MHKGSDSHTHAVVTIGNFDGVHRGHQALLHKACQRADAAGEESVVLTFEPHPGFVLRGPRERFLITPSNVKELYLLQSGIDRIVTEPFTKEFAALDARDFLQRILLERMRASCIVVGYNFSFGKSGLGNVDLLTAWGKENAVEVMVVPPYVDPNAGVTVSSSLIREYINRGDVALARTLLGHPFSVQSFVVLGEQRGRAQDVPTLNVIPPREQMMPPYGVYAGWLSIDGHQLRGVANWGVRPTFGGVDPVLEIHALEPLLGTHYGKDVRFDILYHLRDERQFESATALVAQIRRDIDEAQELLEADNIGRDLP